MTGFLRVEIKLQHRYWNEIERYSADEIKKGQGDNNRLFRFIRQHGLARKFPLTLSTIKASSQGKTKITADKKIIDAEGRPVNEYNLTDEINKVVK